VPWDQFPFEEKKKRRFRGKNLYLWGKKKGDYLLGKVPALQGESRGKLHDEGGEGDMYCKGGEENLSSRFEEEKNAPGVTEK